MEKPDSILTTMEIHKRTRFLKVIINYFNFFQPQIRFILFQSSWQPECNIDADTLIYEFETMEIDRNPSFKRRSELDCKIKRDSKHILLLKQSKHLDLANELDSDSCQEEEENCKKIKLV